MKIYRVENNNGIGPFASLGSIYGTEDEQMYYDMVNAHIGHSRNHISPPYWTVIKKLSFGSQTIEHLAEWFTKDILDILTKHGYAVSVYKVKDVESISSNQIAFKKSNAILVETLPLDALPV